MAQQENRYSIDFSDLEEMLKNLFAQREQANSNKMREAYKMVYEDMKNSGYADYLLLSRLQKMGIYVG